MPQKVSIKGKRNGWARDHVWESVFRQAPPANGGGTHFPPTTRKRLAEFVAAALAAIDERQQENPSLSLVEDIATALSLGALSSMKQSRAFIAQICRWLDEFADDSQLTPHARLNLESVLQCLLLGLATNKSRAPARRVQVYFVATMIKRLKGELPRQVQGEPPRYYRLGCLLAANYVAIVDAAQRRQFIRLLRRLSKARKRTPNLSYGDPFLIDLLIIHDRLNLSHIEQHWSGRSVRSRHALVRHVHQNRANP